MTEYFERSTTDDVRENVQGQIDFFSYSIIFYLFIFFFILFLLYAKLKKKKRKKMKKREQLISIRITRIY